MAKKNYGKGQKTEEALRSYFLNSGYFVVRSVPFKYKEYDITDVDLWLYKRASSITRERINVDIKRKKTPQVIERIFWTKGLQEILGLDKCVVATTDKRKESREFGAQHDVIVLDGTFLQGTVEYSDLNSKRITEEIFINELDMPCTLDSKVSWQKYYLDIKKILLTDLNYDGCNVFLDKISFLFSEMLSTEKHCVAVLRLLYATISYLLITIDYKLRLLIYRDSEARKKELTEGFRYGEAGQLRADEILNTSLQLLSDSSVTDLFERTRIQNEIKFQLESYPAEILGEYFSKNDVIKNIISISKQFESMAFNKDILYPSLLDAQLKAILGLLADFYKIDRKKII